MQNNISKDFIEKLKNKHIKHVYGKLYADDPGGRYGKLTNLTLSDDFAKVHRFVKATQSANNIRLINDERSDDSSSQEHFAEIKNIIEAAREIIIIGFGFDRGRSTGSEASRTTLA